MASSPAPTVLEPGANLPPNDDLEYATPPQLASALPELPQGGLPDVRGDTPPLRPATEGDVLTQRERSFRAAVETLRTPTSAALPAGPPPTQPPSTPISSGS
ncbi:hypothetical protein OBBRIDRAFT_832626 [Obba rivulosa]|uniref:Uncharacterized protein n=1 Tax=Obba rivulosa TaxID=1052685 RepID=A0A8E2DPV7_9APHY|nr:hypothetical protein OBBRIDRAFT_832626 [Obba rivulosa]